MTVMVRDLDAEDRVRLRRGLGPVRCVRVAPSAVVGHPVIMPTTRTRHQITETDEVARALDDAARRWPDETSRARLLARLVAEGHRAIADERTTRAQERARMVRETSGAGAGWYGPGYLAEQREDWPE